MKLLIVLPSLDTSWGGPTQVAKESARALLAQGLDVEIAAIGLPDEAKASCQADGRLFVFDGIPTRFFKASPLAFRQYVPSWAFARWIWSAAKHYDLLELHYLFCFSTTVASLAARFHKRPYGVRSLGQLSPWSLQESALRKRIYTFCFDARTLKSAKFIRVSSQQEAREIQALGISTPLLCVPHGIAPRASVPDAALCLKKLLGIPEQSLLILFLSRLHHKKRLELLLNAYAILPQGDQAVHIIIAGSGRKNYEKHLEELASTLGIKHRVHFMGHLDGAQKYLVLDACDIFVLPSHQENFGVAIAEAMQAGMPVIVSKEVALAEDVERAQAGLILQQARPEELRKLLNMLLGDKEKRQALGHAGQKYCEHAWSWEKVAKTLKEFYTVISNS